MAGQAAAAATAGSAPPSPPRPAAAPPFTVDAMLGSLARKLRMMGFDAEYARAPAGLGPAALSRMAAGGRTLVTRSGPLAARARKAGAAAVVLPSGSRRGAAVDEADLAELARQAGIRSFEARADRSRCAACNGALAQAERQSALPEIPPRVAEACGEFWRCRRCSKLYWDGTHMRGLQALAARLNERQ